jgi:carbon monoxide dehydrogenase subunit G
MLTLNDTFAVSDPDHVWSVISDLNTLVPCVPGARVTSADGPESVKAQIDVRMGAMGMTFSGPVQIESADPASRTVRLKANTREVLGQSNATGDVTISVADGKARSTPSPTSAARRHRWARARWSPSSRSSSARSRRTSATRSPARAGRSPHALARRATPGGQAASVTRANLMPWPSEILLMSDSLTPQRQP